jgi:hypothetical protein
MIDFDVDTVLLGRRSKTDRDPFPAGRKARDSPVATPSTALCIRMTLQP